MAGNIHIIEAEDCFKRVHRSIITHSGIDCEALGVYVRILVLGEKWKLNIKGLSTHLGMSDAKVRKAICSLEREGYIIRTAVQDEKGKMAGWDYNILPYPKEEEGRSRAGVSPTYGKTDNTENRQDGTPTRRNSDKAENGEDNIYRLKEDRNLNEYETGKEKRDIPPTPKSVFDFRAELLSLGCDAQVVDDWLQVRKAKKGSNTLTALKGLQREAEKAGITIAEAVQIAAERGWVGFTADYVTKDKPKKKEKEQEQEPYKYKYDWGDRPNPLTDWGKRADEPQMDAFERECERQAEEYQREPDERRAQAARMRDAERTRQPQAIGDIKIDDFFDQF